MENSACYSNCDNEKEIVLHLPKGQILEMVLCPKGTFLMGSPESELGHCDDETLHQVSLTKDFYLGRFPVSQEQYLSVMGDNPSNFKKDKHCPVENVSWNMAEEFCNKANELAKLDIPKGYTIKLPTEAQWEYACRAGASTSLYSGFNLTSESGKCSKLEVLAWYHKNSSSTKPLGQKQPNFWGLYDMLGNVWEWCRDNYKENLLSLDNKDPFYEQKGENFIFRGGSWDSETGSCRCAFRGNFSQDYRYMDLGFRVALVSN